MRILAAVAQVKAAARHVIGVVAVTVALVLGVRAIPIFYRIVEALALLQKKPRINSWISVSVHNKMSNQEIVCYHQLI